MSRRSILLGALTGILLNVYSDYTGMILGSASLVKAQLPMSMMLPFVAWLALNTVLKLLWPKIALKSRELLVIYTMSWIVGTIPASGWTTYWGGIVSAPLYHASPENYWEEHLFEVLPWWSLPYKSEAIIHTYYEGLPPGESIPWMGWFPSLFWWASVSLALVLIGLSLSLIFQKQWEDSERLTFPLATFPLDLTEGFDSEDRSLPPIFTSRLFWWGFFAVFGVFAWNIITYFAHEIPPITIYYDVNYKELFIARNFPPVYYRIMPPVIGFTYLCNADLLLSFWVFRLVAILQQGLMSRVGFTVGYEGQQAEPTEIMNLESHGALVFLAVWSIWTARHHLAKVARVSWRGSSSEDDGLIPYRTAVAILLGSVIFVVCWFHALGLTIPIAILHVILICIAYFTVAKFTALTGFSYLFPAATKGGAIVETLVGTANLTNRDYVGLGLINSSAFFGNSRIPAWPAIPHHLKLFGKPTPPTRSVGAVPIAFVTGLVASCVFIIYLGYSHAGQNLGLTGFQGGNVRTFDRMVTAMITKDKTIFDPAKMGVWFIGFAAAWGLAFLGNRVSGWPIHPLGLAFQNSGGSRYYSFCMMITWAAKLIILKVGGIALYNRARPFFFGLVIGYVVGLGTSSIVDFIWFPDDSHNVHNW
ncbi:MAG: DUF6785 family protein [Candidatus Latescibacterota bacterium]|nr:DUF6785 family protein [Candidatus Latescibacterota bacterium]